MIGRPGSNRTETSPVNKETPKMNVPVKPSRLPRAGLLTALTACVVMLVAAFGATSASADFEILDFDGTTVGGSGEPFTQAGGHPDANTTTLEFPIRVPAGSFFPVPDGNFKDTIVELPPGNVGDPNATPAKCTAAQLAFHGECPPDSQVGTMTLNLAVFGPQPTPIFNMEAQPGSAAQFGAFFSTLIQLSASLRSDDYGLTIASLNSPQSLPIFGIGIEFWGVPADHGPQDQRQPFLRMPTTCSGPLETTTRINSWQDPGTFHTASFLFHDNESPPTPIGLEGCEKVPFTPTTVVQPLSSKADSPTGMNMKIGVPADGIRNPDGIGQSDVKKVEIEFPEGMSVNPASADGLGGCSEAQIGLGTDSEVQCPDSSKIGSTEIETPVLDEGLSGSLYLAKQNENPFGSLLALYLVAENKDRGITIKLPGKATLDPATGRLSVVFDNNPQQPFSNLTVRLKGGERASLKTPSQCGAYDIQTTLTPWSGTAPVTGTSSFTIDEGCDTGGFDPKLNAGTTNPVAGAHSPFVLDVTRNDGEQNIDAINVDLPEGLTAKIAGVAQCSDADAGSGNCPAASQVGVVNVAAGAGPSPVWVPQPGKDATAVYLAGPYKGAPYSIVAKVPAQAGPFDLGTVAVRSKVNVDPETAQVSVQSDSLPQILQGIPIDYREVQVNVDKPDFMLNPTSCKATSIDSAISSDAGAIAHPSSRFQIGSCGDLGFNPKLYTRIWGKTNRGAHPKLRAVLEMPNGGANIGRAAVTLPHSEFLDQGHIRTICTRVQFAANACPAGSVYGYAKAYTPLLDQPLQGPVYLRSSSHKLPDLVADLKGQIHIVLDGRIDSVHKGIRTTFEGVPDAPVSKFIIYMKGGKKGLLQNSTNICKGSHRSVAKFNGQNGKRNESRPPLNNSRCHPNKRKAKRSSHRRARVARASAAG